MVQTTSGQRGGKRDGAGRPKGAIGGRARAQIEAVAERWPDWSPLEHMASVANDETLDAEIRLDAAKAAAPYIHSRLKMTEADPDALVALEEALAAAKMRGAAKVIEASPGLAERLERIMMRADEPTFLVVPAAAPQPARPAPVVIDAQPVEPDAPAGPAPVIEPKPLGAADAAIIAAQPPAYTPFLPERVAFADTDYTPLSAWDRD